MVVVALQILSVLFWKDCKSYHSSTGDVGQPDVLQFQSIQIDITCISLTWCK